MQILGMSLWDYGTDVMDALVELLVSLVWLLYILYLLILLLFFYDAPYYWFCIVMFQLLTLVIQASSNGEYVDLCLEMLVMNFMPPAELLKQPRVLSKKIQVLDRVHSTLRDISNLVPLTPLRLEKIVRDRMPSIYTREPVRWNLGYWYIQANWCILCAYTILQCIVL